MTVKLSKAQQSIKCWCTKIILPLTLLIVFTAISCEKSDNTNPTDEYYVKYEVNSSTIYSGGKLDLIIRTEKKEDLTLVINQRTLHETIIGPVEKGFNASMEVSAQGNSNSHLKLYTNIYVSKNGSPFALKKSDGSDKTRDFVELSYTIDY